MVTDAHSGLILGITYFVAVSLGTIVGAQTAPARSYVSPPMHMEMWPLRHGSEFTPMDRAGIVYSGQTLIVRLTLRNLWAEDVTVTTAPVQWEETVQLTLMDSNGNVLPATQLRAQPPGLSAQRRQAGSIEQRSEAVYIFTAESEDQVELRFAPSIPDGQYSVRATLKLQASPSSGGTVSQTLPAEMHLDFVTPNTRGEHLEVMYREALIARVEDRLFEARERLGELLRLSPNSSAALMLLGDIELKERNVAAARKYYAAARTAVESGTDVDTIAARATRSAGRLQALEQKILRATP